MPFIKNKNLNKELLEMANEFAFKLSCPICGNHPQVKSIENGGIVFHNFCHEELKELVIKETN